MRSRGLCWLSEGRSTGAVVYMFESVCHASLHGGDLQSKGASVLAVLCFNNNSAHRIIAKSWAVIFTLNVVPSYIYFSTYLTLALFLYELALP